MAIPFCTTHIAVSRINWPADADTYEDSPPGALPVVAHVRAVIDSPRASTTLAGGSRDVYEASFFCDPCDLQQDDTITDDDGTPWVLLWARRLHGLGLDYMEGQLRLVSGTGG